MTSISDGRQPPDAGEPEPGGAAAATGGRVGPRRIPAPWLAGLAFLLALAASEPLVERALVPDGEIESRAFSLALLLAQGLLAGGGVWLLARRKSVRTPAWSEAVLFAASVLASAAALEIGARAWLRYFADEAQVRRYALYTDVDPSSYQWTRHHYLNYYPTPGFRRGQTSHNSLGYRGPEISRKKPEGAVRIVALGGSTTYTYRVDDDDLTFTAQLQRLLREEHGHPGVEVVNAGVGGYNSWESLINLETRVLDLDPDLVIVYHGTNDVKARFVRPETYAGDNGGHRRPWTAPRIAPAERSCLLRILLRHAGASHQAHLGSFVSRSLYFDPERGGPRRVLDANPPVYFRRNLESMIAISKIHGVEILLLSWAYTPELGDYCSTPHFQRGFAEGNAVVREVAAKHGVAFYDFAADMPEDRRYWADGRHLNADGALLKARLIAAYLADHGLIPAPREQPAA